MFTRSRSAYLPKIPEFRSLDETCPDDRLGKPRWAAYAGYPDAAVNGHQRLLVFAEQHGLRYDPFYRDPCGPHELCDPQFGNIAVINGALDEHYTHLVVVSVGSLGRSTESVDYMLRRLLRLGRVIYSLDEGLISEETRSVVAAHITCRPFPRGSRGPARHPSGRDGDSMMINKLPPSHRKKS